MNETETQLLCAQDTGVLLIHVGLACVTSKHYSVCSNSASPGVLEEHPSSLVSHQTAVQAGEVRAAWEGQVTVCRDTICNEAIHVGISSNSTCCIIAIFFIQTDS